MKKIIILFCLLIGFNLISATNPDSLQVLLESSHDLDKVRILNQLSEFYKVSNPNKSIEYAMEAYKISKYSDNDSLYCISLNNLAIGHYYLSDYSRALEYNKQALKIANKAKLTKCKAKYLNNLGLIFKKLDNWDQALHYFLQSLDLEKELGNLIGQAESLCNIGNLYYELEKPDKALEYYQSCLRIYEAENNIKGLATILNNIGMIYDEDEMFSIALDYYSKSLKYERELNNSIGIATSLNNIGLTYFYSGIHHKAIEYLKEALTEAEIIGEKYGISNTCLNLGEVYLEMNSLKDAQKYLIIGLEISENIDSKDLTTHANELLSTLYYQKEDYKKALSYFKKAANSKLGNSENQNRSFALIEQKISNNQQEEVIKKLHSHNNLYLAIIIFLLLLSITIIVVIITNRYKLKENLISEMQIANNQLMEMARTDHLTSLSNRRGMIEKIEYEKYRFERNKNSFVIAMGDIDDFKMINDRFGHECGDFILKSLSNIMISLLRKQDIVGRWGGEEFLMLLPETRIDGGKKVIEKIRKKIADKPFYYKGFIINVTITFGLSEYSKESATNEIIDNADRALYIGKKEGKNRVTTFVTKY